MTIEHQQSPATTAEQSGAPRLSGNLRTVQLVLSVMAWNAPLVIVMGVIPVMVAVGNGVGTPVAFIVAGAVVGAFAVGFTRMARVLPKPGAFYAYITAGLGKEVGLGAGLVTLLGYFAGYAGTFAFGGVVLGSLVEQVHGPSLPWPVWASVFWAGAAVLGYLHIELSAKVMSVLLLGEVAVVVAYDLAVAAHTGGSGLSAAPFAPSHWFDGSFGLALLYGLGMYGGFEVTALYRDEVRSPERTVPRATFAVIATAMVLYATTSWAFVNAIGADKAVAVVTAAPEAAMTSSFASVGSRILLDVATVLVNTSTLAVLVAGHNIVSRYLFNLAADRILPRQLGAVHPRHRSPHRASVVASLAALAVNVPVVILGLEPLGFYAAMLGITSFVLILAMFLTNLSVPVYMRRHGKGHASMWTTVLCPLLAGTGLVAALILAAVNFPLMIAGSTGLAVTLLLFLAAVFGSGMLIARRFRRTRPDVYQHIGRQ
ncbi:APC family permease [Streptomyces sp. NPDC000151]|uniref:APC family permease n=1 Tax=Streptomyces sp. NPDC000151 TaxID=3154244 RepID=UPI00332504A4